MIFDGDASGAVDAANQARAGLEAVNDAANAAGGGNFAGGFLKAQEALRGIGETAEHGEEQMHSLARGMRFAASSTLALEGQIQHSGHAIVGIMMGMGDPMMLAAMGIGTALELITKNLGTIEEALKGSQSKFKEWAAAVQEGMTEQIKSAYTELTKLEQELLQFGMTSHQKAEDNAKTALGANYAEEVASKQAIRDIDQQIANLEHQRLQDQLQSKQNQGLEQQISLLQQAKANAQGRIAGLASEADALNRQIGAAQDLIEKDNQEAARKEKLHDVMEKIKKSNEDNAKASQQNYEWTKKMQEAATDWATALGIGVDELMQPGALALRGGVNPTGDATPAFMGGDLQSPIKAFGQAPQINATAIDEFSSVLDISNDELDALNDSMNGIVVTIHDEKWAREQSVLAQQQATEDLKAFGEAAQKSAETWQRVIGGIAQGVVTGKGGSSIGGVVGQLAGTGAGMLLGDPTGAVGGGIGGALGSSFGGIFDKLKPFQDVATTFGKALETMARPAALLATPLQTFAQFFNQMVEELLPAWMPVFQSLTVAMNGLVGVAEVLLDIYVLLDAVIMSVVDVALAPFGAQIVNANNGLLGFSKALLEFTNQVIQFADSLGAHIAKVDPNSITGYGDPSCFAPSTPVPVPTGSRPIISIEVGDLVVARDMERGILVNRKVTKVVRGRADELIVVHVGEERIGTTGVHRWWVTSRSDGSMWVYAEALVAGDRLLCVDGTSVAVDRIERRPGPVEVCNLEVEGAHTFHVGHVAVLVHTGDKTKEQLAAAAAQAKNTAALQANTNALNAQQNNLPPGWKGLAGAAFGAAPINLNIVNWNSGRSIQEDLTRLKQAARNGSLVVGVSSRGVGDQKG
jgi:hypothetical protein